MCITVNIKTFYSYSDCISSNNGEDILHDNQ